MFSPASDSSNSSSPSASLTYIRIPIGATDLSARSYTYDDLASTSLKTDVNMTRFDMVDNVPEYVFDVLSDIIDVSQGRVKVHLCPWSMVSLPAYFISIRQVMKRPFYVAWLDEGLGNCPRRQLSGSVRRCLYVIFAFIPLVAFDADLVLCSCGLLVQVRSGLASERSTCIRRQHRGSFFT